MPSEFILLRIVDPSLCFKKSFLVSVSVKLALLSDRLCHMIHLSNWQNSYRNVGRKIQITDLPWRRLWKTYGNWMMASKGAKVVVFWFLFVLNFSTLSWCPFTKSILITRWATTSESFQTLFTYILAWCGMQVSLNTVLTSLMTHILTLHYFSYGPKR